MTGATRTIYSQPSTMVPGGDPAKVMQAMFLISAGSLKSVAPFAVSVDGGSFK